MAKFRKRPVVIDAEQWFPGGASGMLDVRETVICTSCGKDFERTGGTFACCGPTQKVGVIPTLEGPHIASPGDWIITGVKGERYPCKPDVFALTYEAVPSEGTGDDK
jgi:hypothetical protein